MIAAGGIEFEIEDAGDPLVFSMASHDRNKAISKLQRIQVDTMETDLHIWHESEIQTQGLRWQVSDQNRHEPLLALPQLEAIVLDTHQIQEAAVEKYTDFVGAEKLEINMAENGMDNVFVYSKVCILRNILYAFLKRNIINLIVMIWVLKRIKNGKEI